MRPAPFAILLLVPTLVLAGCNSDDDDAAAPPPPVPASVVIEADRSLATAEELSDSGAGLAGTGVVPTTAGLDLDATPFATTVVVATASLTDIAAAAAAMDADPAPTPDDGMSTFVANVAVAAENFPAGSTLTTQALAPYDTVATDPGGFAFDASATPLVAGSLQLRVTVQEDPSLEVLSNAIPTHRFTIRQVTEEVTNTFQGGWVAYDGELFFRSLNFAAKDKGFAHDDDVGTSRILFDMNGTSRNEAILFFGERLGKLYLRARSQAFPGRRLYWFDGSTSEVRPVSRVNAGADTAPSSVVEHDGALYYVASIASGVRKVLRYTEDGTGNPVSLDQISDTAGMGVSDAPSDLVSCAGDLFFAASTATGDRKLFRFDDDGGTLRQVTDEAPGGDDAPDDLTVAGGALYLTLQNDAGARKLYRFDPLNDSLERVCSLAGSTAADDDPSDLTTDGQTLIFSATDGMGARKLFAFDASAARLRQASNTAGTGLTDDPASIVPYAGEFYFTAANDQGVRKLYAYRPATESHRQVVDLMGDSALDDGLRSFIVYADQLFFTGLHPMGGQKLFVYEAQAGRVTQVSDLTGDPATSDDIAFATVYGDRLLFTARSNGGDIELFRLCDLSMGCTD